MKHDILGIEDVQLMVDTFYNRVKESDLIGPIFNEKIPSHAWPPHLEKMYRFWYTILFNEVLYRGAPFPPHAQLPIEKKHFDQWVHLFTTTVDDLFEGTKADEAKMRAMKMAELFQVKIEALRNTGMMPLV